MKHTVPTLAALALMGAAPAFGASIADDLVIKPAAQVQVRAQFGASETNTTGSNVNIYNGATADTEGVRFGVRRARFGASAANSTGWMGNVQFRAGELVDESARSTYVSGASAASASNNTSSSSQTNVGGATGTNYALGNYATSKTRTAELYYANVGKTFKSDGFEGELVLGLDKPFNAESSISSSAFMFPTSRAIDIIGSYRDVGVNAKATVADMVRVGFGVMNGSSVLSPDANSGAAGLFTSARIEFAPSAEWMPKKKMESFTGTEGTHLVVGFDVQRDGNVLDSVSNSATGNDRTKSVTTVGPDLLFHYNGLSFLAEYRGRKTTYTDSLSATATKVDFNGTYADVLIGYAIPMEAGFAIEPAIRFQKINADSGDDTATATANGSDIGAVTKGEWDYSTSGQEVTFGLNFYWNGHKNKTQLAYDAFTGKTPQATGDAYKAHIFTVQHQLTF